MKNWKNYIPTIVLLIILLALIKINYLPDDSPKGVFRQTWQVVKSNYIDKTCNNQEWNRWKKRYESHIESYSDAQVAIETMLESLDDPYTRFLSKDDFAEQDRSIDSTLQGIGVHITDIDGNIVIISVIDDSPAQKYGLQEKDEIIKIGEISAKGMALKNVAELIRGREGTFVTLSVLRDEKVFVKEIQREKIKIKTVKTKMLDNNIGYIRISSFISFDTANEFRRALKVMADTRGLIVDVRGNYGGLLTNAVEISDMFLKRGNIVSIVNRDGKRQKFSATNDHFVNQKPVVLLIDEASASASEILGGAMKDNKRAILVGETTFGKGKVQMILELPDNSGLNLTVAKYLTPAGIDIDKKGIEPDYFVETEDEDDEEDPCLDKAVELLLKMPKHM